MGESILTMEVAFVVVGTWLDSGSSTEESGNDGAEDKGDGERESKSWAWGTWYSDSLSETTSAVWETSQATTRLEDRVSLPVTIGNLAVWLDSSWKHIWALICTQAFQ